MIDLILFLPLLVSFFVTLFFLPVWIKKARSIGLEWEDMNKINRKKVSGSGGIIMLTGFIAGVFAFVAYKIFFLNKELFLVEILSVILVVILASSIGFIDDLLGWKSGGMSRRTRLILLALAAIPLIAINAGKHAISIPLIGNMDLGIIYPLVLIPIGIMGATSTYNFLAGFNGLEAGQGIIILTSLSFVAYYTGSPHLAFIALCMSASLLAFLFYNFNPAKIFPGDSLTYAIGALIASLSIVGNFEKIAVFFFIPYILETFLKLRGKLVKYSFGRPSKDGSLDMPYDKIYGLEHASIYLMKKLNVKPTETKVVLSLWAFQILVILIGFIIFRKGIFLI